MKLIVHVDDIGFVDQPEQDRIIEIDYDDTGKRVSMPELASNRCVRIGTKGLVNGTEYIPPHRIKKIYIQFD
jgi:hypothetical protein